MNSIYLNIVYANVYIRFILELAWHWLVYTAGQKPLQTFVEIKKKILKLKQKHHGDSNSL